MVPETGLCEGCFRTIDEIAAWSRLADDAKRSVWQLIEQRRVAAAGSSGSNGHVSADQQR